MKRGPADPREAAKRAALNALRRTRRKADRSGVDLSEWEGEFLGSVETRIQTYGRAFGDPEKGAPGQALSALQHRKLKEIAAKAAGKPEEAGPKRRQGFRIRGRRPAPGGDETD